MKLNDRELENTLQWKSKGYQIPSYNREELKRVTRKEPVWIHFGAGNIFRAFPAAAMQKLIELGLSDKGIIAAEGFDYEIIDKANHPYDDLSLLVTLKADGTIEKTVIGSVVESIKADSSNDTEFQRLKDIFCAKSLQMVSFTITEKGYSLTNAKGEFMPDVVDDFKKGPSNPKSYMGKVASLCYERFLAGELPFAMVSMDNCSHNGDKLFSAVNSFAKEWCESSAVPKEFVEYINSDKVSFPLSMIDKITPRPNEQVKEMLEKDGFEDGDMIITSKNTYTAAFVNGEEAEYMVIEDDFPNGRPCLEKSGIIFTDRATVDKTEKMKVCTCLNPLHTSLAIFGCLLSYETIAEEMKDRELRLLVEKIGYKEGLPVVTDPIIIRPDDFLREVLNIRFPNPFMPDSPQRIATDTSAKLSIRFGETMKAYQSRTDLDIKQLKLIPLVLAGWCRYLLGVNDDGEHFELSPDPLLEKVQPYLIDVKLGQNQNYHEQLKPILSDSSIFGLDLYESGVGELVESYFAELTAGVGSVRSTLKKYVSEE